MNFNKVLKDFSGLIAKANEQWTPRQQMELAQFKSKTNNLFKNVDLHNPDLGKLQQEVDKINELVKNITDGIANSR